MAVSVICVSPVLFRDVLAPARAEAKSPALSAGHRVAVAAVFLGAAAIFHVRRFIRACVEPEQAQFPTHALQNPPGGR